MAVAEKQVDQFRNLLDNVQEMEKEIEDLKAQVDVSNAKLIKEIEDNKALKQYQWLQELDIDYWTINVRDRTVVDCLLLRASQAFGDVIKKDITADDKEAKRYARQRVDFIVTACVRYGCKEGWEKVYARYIKDHNRIASVGG